MQTEIIDKRLGEWTDDRVELLKELHREGCYSRADLASEINKLTGSNFTRGAVIGKIDRLFGALRPVKTEEEKALATKARMERDAQRKRERRSEEREYRGVVMRPAPKAGGREKPAPFIAQLPADVAPLHICLMDLTDETCRWPYHSDGDITTYCGCYPKQNSSYCHAHHAVAYQKRSSAELSPEERKRRSEQFLANAELKRRQQHRQARA